MAQGFRVCLFDLTLEGVFLVFELLLEFQKRLAVESDLQALKVVVMPL